MATDDQSPDDEATLEQLLDHPLDKIRSERLEELLEAHPEWASQLEDLTDFPEFRRDYLLGARETLASPPEELIGKLKSADFSSGSHSQSSPAAADLSFLDQQIGGRGEGAPGQLDQYEIHELIARGGMGLVLRARDPHLDRPIAIKALDPQLAAIPQARDLFLKEARAAASLDHPNILPIHAVHPGRDVPYFVMPLVEGPTLQELVARDGALPAAKVIELGRKLGRGIAAAHAAGLVHRDIKPANILLDEADGRIWIADFGVAQAGDSRRGCISGTPQFMAPEQGAGGAVGPASDLYGLGAVLYFAATGHPPGAAGRQAARSLNPELPAWLDRLVGQLLQEDPELRPASATAVVELLDRHSGRRIWPLLALAVAAMLLVAAASLAANERGFVGGINQALCRLNGERIWVAGRIGTAPDLATALSGASGEIEVVIEGDGRIRLEPLTLPPHPAVLRSAPGAQAELHQADLSAPLIHAVAPLTIRGLTLHRDSSQGNRAPLMRIDGTSLEIEESEIIQAEDDGRPYDVVGMIELTGRCEVEVARSALLATRCTIFRLPVEDRGSAITVTIRDSVIGAQNLVSNLGAEGRTIEFHLDRVMFGGRSILVVDPRPAETPTRIVCHNSAIRCFTAMIWLPTTNPRDPLPWLSWEGENNLFSDLKTYTRYSANPAAGSAQLSPKSVAAWAELPWVTERGSVEGTFTQQPSSSADRSRLRPTVSGWLSQLRHLEASLGTGRRGPSQSDLPFLSDSPG